MMNCTAKKNLKQSSIITSICSLLFVLCLFGCASGAGISAPHTPVWVNNRENAYPSRDWIAVSAQGVNQQQAEAAAMNALARAFRTNVESITNASLRFSQIVNNAVSMRNIAFEESKNYTQEVNTTTNVRGLIGVQIDTWYSPDGTVYVNARMNRRECAARYSGIIRENTAIISNLLTGATAHEQGSFEAYSYIAFAHALAQITDNFQHILEVLDPTAVNRKPAYGGANAIRTAMLECSSLLTIGIAINTERPEDTALFTRALGSFFRDFGFRINEQGAGYYVLRANIRFEELRQNIISCRYYLDAALTERRGTAIFSFTEDDRKTHPNTPSEARRLAVQAIETSLKEGKFASEFITWVNSLLD
jgi:hypothetical protein